MLFTYRSPLLRIRLFRWLGLGVALFLVSCSSDSSLTYTAQASTSGGQSFRSDKAAIKSVEASLNRWRGTIGRAPIQRHAGLDKMAQQHCEFLARNRGKFKVGSTKLSHVGFEERAFKAQRAYGMAHVSENVAGGIIHGDVGPQICQAWINSGRHAYNLRQKWDYTGFGIVVADDGMVYVTQLFATRNHMGQDMGMPERFRPF